MLSICAISDLHGYLPELEPCDLVLICGDSVPLKYQSDFELTYNWYIKDFRKWAEELECDKVLFIAGNHECTFPRHSEVFYEEFPEEDKITYLQDSEYIYKGNDGKDYIIYGTPWCKVFGRWAFMTSDENLEILYSDIPEDLDILMTHDQPYGYGDVLLQKDCPWANGEHIGNKPLAKIILEKQPKYLFCAHLHSTDHSCIEISKTKRYNVSLKDERYQPVYKPLYLTIDK